MPVVPDDARLHQLSEQVAVLLAAGAWRLVTAESCTGGWIAKVLTDVPGSSVWFERGLVTYSNEAKMALLGVPESAFAGDGAVSEAVVRAMAAGGLGHGDANLAVAVSGVAGPGGGSPLKPVGTVWLAWASLRGPAEVRHAVFPGDRDQVRRQAVAAALEGVLAHVRSCSE